MPKHSSKRERRWDEPRCERMMPNGFQCNGPALKGDTICGYHKDADAKKAEEGAGKIAAELAKLRRWNAGLAGLTFLGMDPEALDEMRASIEGNLNLRLEISDARRARLLGERDAIDAELKRQREAVEATS